MTMQESDEKVLRGWVFKKREHKKIIFIDLRTKDGIIQCVINKEKVSPDVWETADELTQESCIEVSGSIVEQPKAPGGRELQVNKIKVYHIAESPYPLGKRALPRCIATISSSCSSISKISSNNEDTFHCNECCKRVFHQKWMV